MYLFAWKAILLLPLLSGNYLTISFAAADDDYDERVLNGKPVHPPHSRPYVVQIEANINNERVIYAGIIYDEWTIVTSSAHIEKATRIFAGKFYRDKYEESQQERAVCMHSKHPDVGGIENLIIWFDYGVLHLSVPLIFNEFVQAGKFPIVGGDVPLLNCVLTGWGRTTSGTGKDFPPELREASVSVLPTLDCKYQYSTVLCISSGGCWYDWGSPVTCKGVLGSDVVIGYVTAVYKTCANTIITSMASLPLAWLDIIFADAKDKCRQKPPPGGGDCCNNGGHVNGDAVIPHSRPYIVQIFSGTTVVATGVIINAYTIITSANKLDKISKVTAGKHFLGKYEATQQTRRVCSTSKHQSAGSPENANNYGLIHLNDPFIFNEFVSPIGIAPQGYKPMDKCTIVAWQGTAPDTVLREQFVKFKDPSTCKNVHETITCVEGGACLHEWGSPVICSQDSKIFLHAIASSTSAYCKNGVLASIAEIPRAWLATEMRNAENTCGKSIR